MNGGARQLHRIQNDAVPCCHVAVAGGIEAVRVAIGSSRDALCSAVGCALVMVPLQVEEASSLRCDMRCAVLEVLNINGIMDGRLLLRTGKSQRLKETETGRVTERGREKKQITGVHVSCVQYAPVWPSYPVRSASV